MNTTEDNKKLVEEFFGRLNEYDLAVIDELCAEEFAVEIGRKGTDEPAIGVDGLKALYEEYYAAFPDFHHDIDEMIAEDDLVAVFLQSRGTHEGAFRGVQPTGNPIEIEDTGLLWIQDNAIVRVRPLSDMLGLFEQLGVGLNR